MDLFQSMWSSVMVILMTFLHFLPGQLVMLIMCDCMYVLECRLSVVGSSSFFLGKVTALGVLCCFDLFVRPCLLASFYLPSHLSLKTCMYNVGLDHPPSSGMR